MPEPSSLDRDLLLGILAVQLDFISITQLGNALGMRLRDPSQPLGELLVRDHSISGHDQVLLEALVERWLAAHDNEASRSLAAVNLSRDLRQFFENLASPILSSHLSQITVRGATDDQATASFDEPIFAANTDRYQDLRFHRRGGLGEVFVAKDAKLNRSVAVKRIHARYADDPQRRARLLLEAEVTGRLEHPGIVPVYDLGTDESGRPFYVMRFIRGESLKERIEKYHANVEQGQYSTGERTVEFRKLLGHLIDVCDAVAYAHSRGILHRDIKPANIMLGDYGETLLVDWGLTKIVSKHDSPRDGDEPTLRPGIDSGDPTAEGVAVGTPAYMSPEQAAGRIDEMTSQSDVYSLGATLYTLLTRRSPFDTQTEGYLQKILRGDVTPPETICPGLPKPLASICRKAMQREPADRYASPQDMAADIERWLADEPVTAHPESRVELAQRFYRKNRTLVAIASLFLLVLTLGLLTATSTITGKNIKLQRAVAQATDEKIRAEGNAVVAQEFATTLLDTADQQLSQIPNQFVARAVLTSLAAERLESLFAQNPRDAGMRMVLARSLLIRGNLLKGTTEKARAEADYQQAIKHYQALVASEDHGTTARDNLVGALIDYADYLAEKRLKEADDKLQNARKVLATMPNEGTVEFQRTLARFRAGLASVLYEMGDTAKSAELYRQSADIFRALVPGQTYHLDSNLLLGALESHAEMLIELEQFASALKVLTEADAVSSEKSEHRGTRDDRNMRAHILLDAGALRLRLESEERRALEDIREAMAIWEALVKEYPVYLLYHRHIAEARVVLARYHVSQRQLETAEALIKNLADELKNYSTSLSFCEVIVDALECEADWLAACKRAKLAREKLQEAIDLQMEIVAAKPGNVVETRRLSELQKRLGELAHQTTN